MVIEKIHGLQATSLSLNERFTILQSAPPDYTVIQNQKPRRRQIQQGSFRSQNINLNDFRNRNLIEQIARHLEQQARRRTIRQRLGVPQGALRKFGSESNLPELRRSNSFGNLSQHSVKNRLQYRQFNGNLRRWASFGNMNGGGVKRARYRRRGQMRGNMRGQGRMQRSKFRGRQGQGPIGRGMPNTLYQNTRPMRGTAMRARGRGGIRRSQAPKPVPTKEELDNQLDQYMANSKMALDKELEAYMNNADEEME